ncbi:uncharacterized protein G2W53_025586 [Senna tora]|uniref:Uncharacterized protein n=1 Tax=Senna tora TaxID=362788 RepID=A0A834WI19_9FABA|nr:uncharacterized protein G2W53_025586 [Senna tora]
MNFGGEVVQRRVGRLGWMKPKPSGEKEEEGEWWEDISSNTWWASQKT